MTTSRNPNDRTSTLHPVMWAVEPALKGGVEGWYAYGFGGGLPEAMATDVFGTQIEAIRDLRNRLAKVGRRPSPEGIRDAEVLAAIS